MEYHTDCWKGRWVIPWSAMNQRDCHKTKARLDMSDCGSMSLWKHCAYQNIRTINVYLVDVYHWKQKTGNAYGALKKLVQPLQLHTSRYYPEATSKKLLLRKGLPHEFEHCHLSGVPNIRHMLDAALRSFFSGPRLTQHNHHLLRCLAVSLPKEQPT